MGVRMVVSSLHDCFARSVRGKGPARLPGALPPMGQSNQGGQKASEHRLLLPTAKVKLCFRRQRTCAAAVLNLDMRSLPSIWFILCDIGKLICLKDMLDSSNSFVVFDLLAGLVCGRIPHRPLGEALRVDVRLATNNRKAGTS